MKNFEKSMEQHLGKVFDEADMFCEKLPNVSLLRRMIARRKNTIEDYIRNHAIQMETSVKLDDRFSVAYKRIRDGKWSNTWSFEIVLLNNKSGISKKFRDIEDDGIYFRAAMAIPDLLRKIKNEAHRLKRELCKEIDQELEVNKEMLDAYLNTSDGSNNNE